jgi:hypothetical protein
LTAFQNTNLIVTCDGDGWTTALSNFRTPNQPGVMFQQGLVPCPQVYKDGGWSFSAVLLPYRPNAAGTYPAGKILLAGAGFGSYILDLDNPSAGWILTPSRGTTPGRDYVANRDSGFATILATGDIILTGGVENRQQDGWPNSSGTATPDTSVRVPEIYREDLNRWDIAANTTAAISRNYHSVALLLPDGRVWTAGGNKQGGYAKTEQFSGKFNGVTYEPRELRAEYFSAWYKYVANRPQHSAQTPRTLPRSGDYVIRTGPNTTGTSITRVALIAPGSVTHSFDVDQRYVELRIKSKTSTTVTVTVPDQPGVLPPGQYMLFISRSITGNPAGNYLPSIGYWVNYPSAPPPTPPCSGGQYCCDQWYCPPNGCPIICNVN